MILIAGNKPAYLRYSDYQALSIIFNPDYALELRYEH
jgi:hypothetical protein